MDNVSNTNGGMFGPEGIVDICKQSPHFLKEPCLKLVNGRSAIKLVCEYLDPRKIWMPSYLCHTMLDALPVGSEVEFYPIGKSLYVCDLDWLANVDKNDLVLAVDYFGFNLNQEVLKEVKKTGAFIIQDAAQALLSTFDRCYADFVMYSPRKTLGVPDGGILKSRCEIDLGCVKLNEPPSQYVMAAYEAFFERGYHDRSGMGSWFSYYKKAEKLNPAGPYKMSSLAQALLDRSFDYGRIATQRRRNYKKISSELSDVTILKDLPDNVVPLNCPIFINDRQHLLARLYEKQFYCPVHWPINGFVPESFKDSHDLSNSMISVLCDQRLTENNLDDMVRIIRDYI